MERVNEVHLQVETGLIDREGGYPVIEDDPYGYE